MLDNPLDFYSAIEDGNLIQLSSSMYEFLRKQAKSTDNNTDQFLYHTTESDAVVVWKEVISEKVRYYARQLYTVLYDHDCGGHIVTTYVGDPIDVAPHPFAFACMEFHGQLAGLSFLKKYRFNNLNQIRRFIRYIESDLCSPVGNPEFEFLMHVRPDCYLSLEELTSRKQPFVFAGQLPY